MTYLRLMLKLAEEAEDAERFAEKNPLPTCEYTSSKEIQLARLRNRTFKFDPNQKQQAPVNLSAGVWMGYRCMRKYHKNRH